MNLNCSNVNENCIDTKSLYKESLRKRFELLKDKRLKVSVPKYSKSLDEVIKKQEEQKIKNIDCHDLNDDSENQPTSSKMIGCKQKNHKESIESIIPYMGAMDKFQNINHGKDSEKSVLELEIEEAVIDKNLKKAELLSDDLSLRNLGKRICDAFDAKEYDEKQKEVKEKKKKKKLKWGFVVKNPWEMKANM